MHLPAGYEAESVWLYWYASVQICLLASIIWHEWLGLLHMAVNHREHCVCNEMKHLQLSALKPTPAESGRTHRRHRPQAEQQLESTSRQHLRCSKAMQGFPRLQLATARLRQCPGRRGRNRPLQHQGWQRPHSAQVEVPIVRRGSAAAQQAMQPVCLGTSHGLRTAPRRRQTGSRPPAAPAPAGLLRGQRMQPALRTFELPEKP